MRNKFLILAISVLSFSILTNTSVASAADDWAYHSESLVGKAVVNNSNTTLGEVSTLIFDKTGQISHFVLASGGFLGFSQKNTIVPWSRLSIQTDEVQPEKNKLIADITQQELSHAKPYNFNTNPLFINPDLRAEVDFYIEPPKAAQSGNSSNAVVSQDIRGRFKKYDKDNNGKLSRNEIDRDSKSENFNFDQADLDDNGKISHREFSIFYATM